LTRVTLALAFLLLTIGPAAAQTVTVTLPASTAPAERNMAGAAARTQAVSLDEVREVAQETRAVLREQVLRGALDPSITGRNSAPAQGASLEVGKDGEAVGKARLSWKLDDYNSAVEVILKGPINQSSGVPLTDRGLASGASVTLGYNLTLWGSGSSVAQSAIDSTRSLTTGPASLSPLESLIATGLALQAASAPGNVYADSTLQALNRSATQKAFESRNPRAIAYALREAGTAKVNRTLALRGSYSKGSTTFKFAELADPLVETTDTKSDSSKALSVAYMQFLKDATNEAPLMLISGGFARTNAWKAARSRQICTPLGVGSATECRALIIGAPTNPTVDSYEIDIRSWAYAQKLGVNPHFSYDKETKKWTSEIALSYLVLKDDVTKEGLPQLDTKALTVGLRVGSRPEEDGGIYAAFFFGTVLSK
jgi:hypothetical protein